MSSTNQFNLFTTFNANLKIQQREKISTAWSTEIIPTVRNTVNKIDALFTYPYTIQNTNKTTLDQGHKYTWITTNTNSIGKVSKF